MKKRIIIFLIFIMVKLSFSSEFNEVQYKVDINIKERLNNTLAVKVLAIEQKGNKAKMILDNYDVISIYSNIVVIDKNYNLLPKRVLFSSEEIKYIKSNNKLIIQVIEVRK